MTSKVVKSNLNRGKTPKAFNSFLHEVRRALEDGYKLPEEDNGTVRDFPVFMRQFAVLMTKDEAPKDILDVLEDKSLTKDDLKELCEKEGLEYPDLKYPAQVRKQLKETIKAGRDKPPTEENTSGDDEESN